MAIDKIGDIEFDFDVVVLNRGEVIAPQYQTTIGGQVYYFMNDKVRVKAPLKVKVFNITAETIKQLEDYAVNETAVQYQFYKESGIGRITQIKSERVIPKLSERKLDLYNAIIEIKEV